MKRASLIVTLFVILSLSAFADDWITNPLNGYLYTIVKNNSSWQDAENKAIALGGHLVTIRNQAENDWVYNFVLEKTDSNVYGAWIGLYQFPGSIEPAEGWVWSSGELVTYTNWQKTTGEPNNYGGFSENWAKMYIRKHDWDEIPSYWNDTWFYEPSRPDTVGIVEVIPDPSNIPEQSSLASLILLCIMAGGIYIYFRRHEHRK